jgi:hypothetical protein
MYQVDGALHEVRRDSHQRTPVHRVGDAEQAGEIARLFVQLRAEERRQAAKPSSKNARISSARPA